MLSLHIDPHGQPFKEFQTLRDELRDQELPFSTQHLRLLPYQQLILTAIATAGKNKISLEEVRAEKKFRRSRFISMPEDEFQDCRRYLQMQGMFNDLMTERALATAPHWDDLKPHVKVWAKLDCLFNHVDAPIDRLIDLDYLLTQTAHGSVVPAEVANDLRARAINLGARAGSTPVAKFRNLIGSLATEAWEYLSSDEHRLMGPSLMRGYECTADCFRVFTGVKG